MNCLHCGSNTRLLSFRELWAGLWKDKFDGCLFSCNLLLNIALLPALVPFFVAMWLFMHRCDQCGGTNWDLFGRCQKYFPPH